MRHEDGSGLGTDILKYRSGIFHRPHEAVVQIAQVRRLVAHGRRIDLFELVDVISQHHMYGPAGILVVLLDHVPDSAHEAGVLEDHQMGCKNQAVTETCAIFRDFLDLVDFSDGLVHRLQEELFFSSNTAFGEGLLNNRNFPVYNRERLPHGKAGRGRNANQYGTFSLALR